MSKHRRCSAAALTLLAAMLLAGCGGSPPAESPTQDSPDTGDGVRAENVLLRIEGMT